MITKFTKNYLGFSRMRFSFFKILSLLALVMVFGVNGIKAQSTVPTAYSLSSGSFTLSSYTGTSFPANMAIGFQNNATDGTFNTDLTSDVSTNGTAAGNWNDEGSSGISYGGGGSSQRGSFLFRCVSTGRSTIQVNWVVRDITPDANTNYIELQWRSGASGTWNDVTGDIYQQGTTANGTSFSVTLPSGAENLSDLRIRWIYYEIGSGARDRLAIDEITVSSSASSGPLITQTGSLNSFISSAVSTPSAEQTFTVSGASLTNDITVTAPTGYQVSTTSGSGFGSSVTLTQSGGTVATTTIYARFNPTALADQVGGNIAVTSTGAVTQNVAVSGEVTNLSVGAIAFIAFQGVTTDLYRIVALQDIPANTRIWFTDKAWDGNGGTLAFTSGESTNVWTNTTGSTITAGTVIQFDALGAATIGTGGLNSGLGSAGEQLFAYQGTLTSPTFVAGYTSGTIISSGVPTASGTSTWVPASLTDGTNFVALGGTTFGSSYVTAGTHNRTLAEHRTHIHTIGSLTTGNTSTTTNGSWPTYTFNFLPDEPSTQPSFTAATSVGNNQMTLNFSGGNGTSYMVVMRQGSAVAATPTDATNYSAVSGSVNFTTATELSAGERIVYNGTTSNTSVTITNLSPGTTYHYAIYAYNGTAALTNFNITSPGTGNETTTGSANSTTSDIIIHNSFTEPSDIDYVSNQENTDLTDVNSIEVARFTIRDGGSGADADANATTLNAITFTITNHSVLRRLALYNGTTELGEIAVSTGTATFSGLTLSASDDATQDFSLRASFVGTVTDNTQFSFVVSSATAEPTGSTFASVDAGAATSSTTGDRNRVEVIATLLAFVQQPSNVSTNVAMSPSVTVSANDINNNRDLDYVTNMSATTTGTFAGASTNTVTPVAGLGTFSNLQFSAAASARTIAISSGSLTASGNSNTFDINAPIAFGDVIISEISYESTNEWIELHNTTGSSIDISGWYITDHSAYPATSEGDCLIPSGTTIAAGSYLVVSTSGTGTSANDLVDITGEVLSTAGPRGAANRPQLSNSGDNIALYTSASGGTLIDGSLSVNFPDYSGSGTISIERIARETWGTNAFGQSSTAFASATYATSSPGTVGSPTLQANVTVTNLATRTGQIINLSTRTLEIGGTISGSGTLRGGATSNLTITGSSGTINFDQTTPGTTNVLRNLTISGTGTTTLGNALNITGGASFGIVTVGSGATLNTGGNLTLKSDAAGTAAITTSAGTISGNVTVERFIASAGRRWRFLSSPVQSATVANWMTQFYVTGPGTAGSSVGDPNANGWHTTQKNIDNPSSITTTSIRTYNESIITGDLNTGWENLTSTSQALLPGQGFRTFIRGQIGNTAQIGLSADATAQSALTTALTGTINSGDVNANPTFTSSGTLANDGWNLLGNPYPCAYNWNAHFDANIGSEIANMDATIYVYDGTANSYKSYNASTNSGTLTNGIIPSGAGFFAQATASSPILVFKEAYKTTSAPLALHKTDLSDEFSIKYFKDSTESDEIIVKMFNGATLNKDAFDIIKLSNENLNLSAYGTDNQLLTLSAIPFVKDETHIKLDVEAVNEGTYHFNFKNIDQFDAAVSVSLLDKYTNKTTNIRTNTTYSFEMGSAPNQWGKDRFELILNGKTTTGVNNRAENIDNSFIKVYPNPASDVLNIVLNSSEKIREIKLFNVSGKLIQSYPANTNQINISQIENGVYFIEVFTNKEKLTSKFIK